MANRPLRIILASPWAFPFHGYGGLQSYVVRLAAGLQRSGHDVTIAISGLGPNGPSTATHGGLAYRFVPPPVGEAYKNAVAVAAVPAGMASSDGGTSRIRRFMRGVPSYFAFSRNVARWLATEEFDVLHAFKLTPLVYLLRRQRRPVVIQNFAYEEFFLPTLKARLGMLPVRMGIAMADRLADVVLCQGPLNALDVRRVSWADPNKLRVLPNGVDLARMRSVTREAARATLGWPGRQVVLLTVSRLAPDKRVEDGVEVLRLVRRGGIDARLAIVGSGPSEGAILGAAESAGLDEHVRIHRNVPDDDLVAFYRGADIFVNTADTRYALLTVLEALAADLPVVTFRPQEDLVEDDVNGYVVGHPDPAAMAEAVTRCCVTDTLARLRAEAHARVRDYDWAVVVAKATDIYREAIAAGPRGA